MGTKVGTLCNRRTTSNSMRLRGAGGRFRKRLALIAFPLLGLSHGGPRSATRGLKRCLGARVPRIITSFGMIGKFLGLAVSSTY